MRFHLSLILIVSIFSFSIHASEVEVKMMPTMAVVDEANSVIARLEVETFMKSEKVQHELIKQGINPREALDRLASLSASEIKSLSEQIKKSQAGADFGVGGLIGLVVFVFLVLLITDILGFTKVFPFTRSVR
ncbi:MAG: PA2779 family protein [Bacteriovorax sp.]|nr:PA2779 family protein [Bacteriovorax sp.]